VGGRVAESHEGIEIHGGARQVFILKQGEQGTRVAEFCRKAGTSQATHFNWKQKHEVAPISRTGSRRCYACLLIMLPRRDRGPDGPPPVFSLRAPNANALCCRKSSIFPGQRLRRAHGSPVCKAKSSTARTTHFFRQPPSHRSRTRVSPLKVSTVFPGRAPNLFAGSSTLGFAVAKLDTLWPHSFRHMLARRTARVCTSVAQIVATSQNTGHSDTLTTLRSYGQTSRERQRELVTGESGGDVLED